MAATTPGSYAAQAPGATSPAVVLALRPRLTAADRGPALPGLPARRAGAPDACHVRARSRCVSARARGPSPSVPTGPTPRGCRRGTAAATRARVVFAPDAGYAVTQVSRRYRIRTPYLAIGSYGRAVLALERRLTRAALRGAARSNRFFGVDTYEAVLAFQKVLPDEPHRARGLEGLEQARGGDDSEGPAPARNSHRGRQDAGKSSSRSAAASSFASSTSPRAPPGTRRSGAGTSTGSRPA